MTHQLRFAARSDRGLLRSNNQDSVYAGERLLIVADGMGGHAAGDLASRVVVAAFAPLDEQPPGQDLIAPLRRAMDAGNDAIADLVADDPDLDGMGTTATAMLFDGARMALAHIGDSRAYLYRNGVLHQLSHDDTFVQSLVDDGRITEDEAAHHPQRNLLLRALNGSDPEPMLAVREISEGDRFLICSDGLSSVVAAEAIADTLAGPDPDKVADTLIELALIGGGPDNVTVIVADVIDVGPVPATIPAAHDHDDPEATGPILPIHMTQEMPRIPLPVLSDEEAAARSVAQPGYDEEPDDDEPDSSSPPDAPRRWRRRGAFALALLVLLGVAATGSLLWVRTQYYVGADNGQVVIFRGVDGSILGIPLASVAENSCQVGTEAASGCTPLAVNDLVQAARDQVTAGITASSLEDARVVMLRLSGRLLPICNTTPPATTPPSSPAGVSPITTPSPTPSSSVASATPPTSPAPSPATAPSRTATTSAAPSRTPTSSSVRAGASTQGLRGEQGRARATAPALSTAARASTPVVHSSVVTPRGSSTPRPTAAPATGGSTPSASAGVQIPPPPSAGPSGATGASPTAPTSPLSSLSPLSSPSSLSSAPTSDPTATPQVPGVDCR